ncbi:MAG: diacylglycerol kinase family protein [Patescibacteria group bacterium]|jgi:hypothetical protein|nr:diacylglycerol kinase family protein [Patescibacteria group bacterium]
MNVYIYDDFLNKSRYRRALAKVEIRLTDLGLNGKIIRLGAIKNVREVIQSEIKNGAKNIIAVGNNETVNKVVSAIMSSKSYDLFKKELLFSIIPIGDNNSIAESLGIKKSEDACNIILARRVENINIAWAGKNIFINKLELVNNGLKIEIDKKYEIELINKKNSAQIINIADKKSLNFFEKISPQDNLLNIMIDKGKDETFIASKNIKIKGLGEVILDSCLLEKTPIDIGLLQENLNIIVGKERSF